MRRPSKRLTPSVATVTRVVFGKDPADGRTPTRTADPTPIVCAVQPDSAETFVEHMREAAYVYHICKFYDDPRLRIRDEVHYQGRTLAVAGVRDTSGGVGRTWVVLAQERRPGG